MEHIVIWKENDRYCSFPHIVYLPNGNLAVTFRKASKFSAESAKLGIATHHDPDSSIEFIESNDGGKSWINERTIYKSSYGVNDPALTVLRDGSVILRFVALKIVSSKNVTEDPSLIFSHRVEHGLLTEVIGNLVYQSFDYGKSWKEIGLSTCKGLNPSCSRDPIVEMPDGTWVMPVYTGAPQRSDIAWAIRSLNRGKTWCEPIRIMSDDNGRYSQLQGINYNETSLLHIGKGEIIAMVRGDSNFHTENEFMPVGGVGELFVAKSYDGGLSWTKPMKTGIWGQPGSLIKLNNGTTILSTYGYRRSPFGIRCCLSMDNGRTWDVNNEIIIRNDCSTWDCGYPFTIQLKDNSLFSVYYFVDESGTRYISGTNWKVS